MSHPVPTCLQLETIYTKPLSAVAVAITLCNSRKPVCPEITCTNGAKIFYNGLTYTLGAGTSRVLDIRLAEGENTLTVSGSGEITFRYREADL